MPGDLLGRLPRVLEVRDEVPSYFGVDGFYYHSITRVSGRQVHLADRRRGQWRLIHRLEIRVEALPFTYGDNTFALEPP